MISEFELQTTTDNYRHNYSDNISNSCFGVEVVEIAIIIKTINRAFVLTC